MGPLKAPEAYRRMKCYGCGAETAAPIGVPHNSECSEIKRIPVWADTNPVPSAKFEAAAKKYRGANHVTLGQAVAQADGDSGCCPEDGVCDGACGTLFADDVSPSLSRSIHQNVLLDLPEDKGARKATPITTGVIDYFPAALAEVARLSKTGNDQHNPGEPLHWARSKSTDHADCIVRHLMQRGTIDGDGIRHSAKVAWRALALLQEEIEAEAGFVPEEAA